MIGHFLGLVNPETHMTRLQTVIMDECTLLPTVNLRESSPLMGEE